MRLHKDVQRLVKTHGYAVAFSRTQSGGTYDTATGGVIGGESLTWQGRGIFVNYKSEDVTGTSITADDRKLLLQSVGLEREPMSGDLVDEGLQVVNVTTIKSGSTVIGYTLQVRG